MTAIGIDLGTTNSAAAVYDPALKRASILPNALGERLTPSVVGSRVGTDGKNEVGSRALRFAPKDPQNTIVSVKRLMGRDFADPSVVAARERLSYRIVPGPGEDPRAHVMIKEQRYTPAEVSTKILDIVTRDAGRMLGERPTHAVITVPAYFTEAQRAATREAGEQADLVVKRIIDEPTAAAVAFGVNLSEGDRRRILVYDLGGGTFDISILNAVKSSDGRTHFQVLSYSGDTWLGGDDFDMKIVDRITEWVQRNTGLNPIGDVSFRLAAKQHAEQTKRDLSGSEDASIYFGGLRGEDGVMFDVDMSLTRVEFESMIAPLVDRTIDQVRKALEKQHISRDDISDVLLVGGSTLTPMVYQAVEDFFGAAKVRRNVEPMECVALGAGILAGTLLGVECPDQECRTVNEESLAECRQCGHGLAEARSAGTTEVYDVTGMAMGVAAVRGSHADAFVPIIPSGHPYPMTESIRHSFEATDGRRIRVPVFEGDDPVASKNVEVGVIEFDLPEEIDTHTRVEVEFTYDRNRTLAVTISVPGTTIRHHERLRVDIQRIARLTKADAEPEEDEDETGPREDLMLVVDITRRFLRDYDQYLSRSEAIKINGDLERAEQTLVFADPADCRRMTSLLHSDIVGSGLASQLYLAERAANQATQNDAQQINQAITALQKSYQDGRTDAVAAQAKVLKMMTAKVREQNDVAEVEDAEEFNGLLRWLDQS